MNGAPKQVLKVASGLGDADLGAGDLGGVARQEVVHRLVGRQPRDRRQHPNASAVSMTDVRRRRPRFSAEVLGMNSIG
jgi:hypothetical protein